MTRSRPLLPPPALPLRPLLPLLLALLPLPAGAGDASKTPAAPAVKAAAKVFKDCAQCPLMVVVPGGRFSMGSPPDEPGRDGDEGPVHEVAVEKFALGKYEITQGQWRALMGDNPSYFKRCGAHCPVDNVTWDETQEFVRRLSARTGQPYRLPSEAEWEYACRAGGESRLCGDGEPEQVAWYGRNSGGEPQRVGRKLPNAFGLFDMSGNLLEWTQDCWHPTFAGAPADGSAWLDGGDCSLRVQRNGGFDGVPDFLRAANRDYVQTDLRVNTSGLRVARRLR